MSVETCAFKMRLYIPKTKRSNTKTFSRCVATSNSAERLLLDYTADNLMRK